MQIVLGAQYTHTQQITGTCGLTATGPTPSADPSRQLAGSADKLGSGGNGGKCGNEQHAVWFYGPDQHQRLVAHSQRTPDASCKGKPHSQRAPCAASGALCWKQTAPPLASPSSCSCTTARLSRWYGLPRCSNSLSPYCRHFRHLQTFSKDGTCQSIALPQAGSDLR